MYQRTEGFFILLALSVVGLLFSLLWFSVRESCARGLHLRTRLQYSEVGN